MDAVAGNAEAGDRSHRPFLGFPGDMLRSPTSVSHERIAERARALWLASGCLPGRDEQNWRDAETQLEAEFFLE
jgi:hypothetical protein